MFIQIPPLRIYIELFFQYFRDIARIRFLNYYSHAFIRYNCNLHKNTQTQ